MPFILVQSCRLVTETKIRRADPDITIVEIAGRLNLGNLLLSIENTIKRLIDEGSRKLVIDLKDLNSTDSSGIGMLVSCSAHMEHSGGRIRIAGSREAVAKVFAMVHMERIVPLDTDVESACRNLSAESAGV